MEDYVIPFVDESGATAEYGDRWLSHTVTRSHGGTILGRKHVGIVIACLDRDGRILCQFRKHRVFDSVWSLSGDTHPRKYGARHVETLAEASARAAKEDLGVEIQDWTETALLSYSCEDPRSPKYCENELLHLLVTKYDGPFIPNPENVYRLEHLSVEQIHRECAEDLSKPPLEQRFAPWVHSLFARPLDEVEKFFRIL